MKVAKPRIGSGTWAFVVGGAVLLLGLFAGTAGGSAMDAGLKAVGTALVTLGCGLIALGFWISLFHRIELRMIDIQRAINKKAASETAPVAEGQPSAVADILEALD